MLNLNVRNILIWRLKLKIPALIIGNFINFYRFSYYYYEEIYFILLINKLEEEGQDLCNHGRVSIHGIYSSYIITYVNLYYYIS